MNDLMEADEDQQQEQEEGEGSGRGKAASGRRDDQGNRSQKPFGSSIDKNLPKGSSLPMGSPKGSSREQSGPGKSNSNIQRGGLGLKNPAQKSNVQRGGLGNTAKNVAQEKIKQASYEGLRTAGTAAGGVGRIAAEAAIQANEHRRETIYLIILIVALFLLPFFIIFFGFLGDSSQQQQGQTANPLTITKTGPAKAVLGQQLVYQITAGYPGTADDMTITDPLPVGTAYVSSTPAGTYDAATRTVTWSAKALNIPLVNPINMTISLTLTATQDNLKIANIATVSLTNGVLAGGGGAYVAPTTDNCGGKYTFTSPLGKNFGDPSCNFTKDQLYTQLKTADPTNADVWFNKVVPCESGYNPNAYAGPQTGTPDARGAWGLFQMGSSYPPGSPPPAEGKNGPNDRGDVNWGVQIVNATTYGKKLSSLGAYWSCAR